MSRQSERRLAYGTTLRIEDGRPIEAVDTAGVSVWRTQWRDAELVRARLLLPDGRHALVEPDAGDHALFGRVDDLRIEGEDAPRARFGSVSWSRPRSIPPLDRPGALPSGAGTAVLNLLSRLAENGSAGPLRYRGPYPTEALFDTLRSSFDVIGDRDEALARFTADVEATALSGQMRTIDVDFVPAPHEWLFVHPRLCLEARRGIERVFVDGQAYTRRTTGARRLRSEGDDLVAFIEIAGSPWADVARLDRDGHPRDDPRTVPAVESPLLGAELPAEVTAVLGEILLSRAPALMRRMLETLWSGVRVRFGDTGTVLASRAGDAIEIHAILGERLEPLDARSQLALLLHAVEPVTHRWAQAELAARAAAAGLDAVQ